MSIVGITTEIPRMHSPSSSRENQTTSEPSEGIDASPTVFRPHVLHTHDQHANDYIRIMVKFRMSLPLGEDQSAPLVMEV